MEGGGNFVFTGQPDQCQAAILHLYPYANGLIKSDVNAQHMTIRDQVIAMATGCDVVGVPNDMGYDPTQFSPSDKVAISKGDIRPIQARVEQVLEHYLRTGRTTGLNDVAVLGYSQGAVLADTIRSIGLGGVYIEPSNLDKVGLLTLMSRFTRVGMGAVRAAAHDSGIMQLQEVQANNPSPLPMLGNRFYWNTLRNGQFGNSGESTAYVVKGSTVCPTSAVQAASSRGVTIEILDVPHGHAAADNPFVAAGLAKLAIEQLAQG